MLIQCTINDTRNRTVHDILLSSHLRLSIAQTVLPHCNVRRIILGRASKGSPLERLYIDKGCISKDTQKFDYSGNPILEFYIESKRSDGSDK